MITRRRLLKTSIAGAFIGIVGPGHALASPELTSPPIDHESKPATPIPQGEAQEVDVRDVLARDWKYEGIVVSFRGTIQEMVVAPPGMGFELGTEGNIEVFRTQMLVRANFDDGNAEDVLVALDDDPEGLHEDNSVIIVGVYGGEHHEEAVGDGYSHWPLFVASSVTLVPEDQAD